MPTVQLEGLTVRHLRPMQAGKTVPAFLDKLPALYASKSAPIVDDKGFFHVGDRSFKWSEVALRAPGYFDTVLTGQTATSYSKGVHAQLLSLLPHQDKALIRLATFVQRVVKLSTPLLPLTVP